MVCLGGGAGFVFGFVGDVVAAAQAELELLKNKFKLSNQRSQLLETKAERILHDKTTRPTGKRDASEWIVRTP